MALLDDTIRSDVEFALFLTYYTVWLKYTQGWAGIRILVECIQTGRVTPFAVNRGLCPRVRQQGIYYWA